MYDTNGEIWSYGSNSSFDGDAVHLLPGHRYTQSATILCSVLCNLSQMADTFYMGPHETFSQMIPTDQSGHDTETWL